MTSPTQTQPPAEPTNSWRPTPTQAAEGVGRPKPTSLLQSWMATHIAHRLCGFLDATRAGYVFVGLPIYDVWGRVGHHYTPSVSYFSTAKLPTLSGGSDVRVVPDLVIDVIADHDTVGDVEGRTFDYTLAGTQLVWLVFPTIKVCRVQYPDGTGRLLNITGTLDGAQVIPGFTCPVADIFPKT